MRRILLSSFRTGLQIRWKSMVPRKPILGEQGMNAAVFRSVFEPIRPDHPAAKFQNRRFYRRWDWHLRNFIYALMPPAAAWLFIQCVQWCLADEVKAYRDMVEGKKAAVVEKEKRIEHRALTLSERLDAVEQAVQEMEQERARLKKLNIVHAAKEVLANSEDMRRSSVQKPGTAR